jgi:hypothetical protein
MMQLQHPPPGGTGAAELPILCQECGTDPLSDVLRMVKLTGAVFHLVEASFPWGVEIPPAREYSSIILPRAQHVVSYHIILRGSGWAGIPGVASTWFEAGGRVDGPKANGRDGKDDQHRPDGVAVELVRSSFSLFAGEWPNFSPLPF